MGISDSETGFVGLFDASYTSRDNSFADVHNLDQCINYLNQSLVAFGISSELDFYSTEPASIARTCNCMYALIQQRQRDTEFRETADETRRRLLSEMSKLEAKVEMLADQLVNKERELQAIRSKGPGSYEVASFAARSGQAQSQALRHDGYNAEVGEKVKLEQKMRQWQELKLKTPSKILPPRSPSHPKTPAHDRLCPFSPSAKSVKRTLGADCTFLTPRSRFSEKPGSNVSLVDASGTIQKTTDKLKKTLDFELRKPMDILEESVPSTSEEQIAKCSEESIVLSPLIQYDNPMYQEESPPLSERLKSLEKNMRALSPIPVNVEPLRSRQEFSPCKPSNLSTMTLEFENLRCSTPERENTLPDEGPSMQTPNVSISLAALPDSGSLTPFQQFQNKNLDLQMTLVKQYLTVLNTATREELLQLKGIGPKRAADILELRQQSEEPFKDLQDLKSIGLSDKKAFSLFNINVVQKVIFPSS